MKKILFSFFSLTQAFANLYGQNENEFSAIKLFLSQDVIYQKNNSLLPVLQNRLYRKMIQLINQTGTVEIGYSTFQVMPKFDVLTISKSQAGIAPVYMAECELGITITRVNLENRTDAIFNSFGKSIIGSGSSEEDAITNAINIISPTDKAIVEFLNKSKQKIDDYFKNHCDDVIKEGMQARALRQYARSIALFFSVPVKAPCHAEAIERSKGVYALYQEDRCNDQLIKLKAYVTYSLSENTTSKNYYDSALNLMKDISPGENKCFDEARKQIEKIENRLTIQQKEEWEVKKKLLLSVPDVEKERYKAMGKISSTYQPSAPSTNVIIAH